MRKNGTTIAVNKMAYHNYTILETLEAGIVLQGSEVKAMREGTVHIKDAYVFLRHGDAVIKKLYVSPYKPANIANHEPTRDRILLLSSRQIVNLASKIKTQRLTITVLSLFFNARGKVKVSIGLAKGKKLYDKRADLKKKDIERDIKRNCE